MTIRNGILGALIILFVPPHLYGEELSGNAGDIVSCPGFHRELLDHYEARERYGFDIDLGTGTPLERVERVIASFAAYDPERADAYLTAARTFMDHVTMVQEPLNDIPDNMGVVVPEGCKIRQAGILNPQNGDEPQTYTLYKQAWDAMDKNSKAGLILNLIIFKDFIKGGHKDSIATRFFNENLSLARTHPLSFKEYLKLIRLVRAPAPKRLNVPYSGGTLVVDLSYGWDTHPNGNFYSGYLNSATEQTLVLPDGSLLGVKGSYVSLYENGYLLRIEAAKPVDFQVGVNRFHVSGELFFREDGGLLSAEHMETTKVDLGTQQAMISGPIYVMDSGTFEAVLLPDSPALYQTIGACEAKIFPQRRLNPNANFKIWIRSDGSLVGVATRGHEGEREIDVCMMNPIKQLAEFKTFKAKGFGWIQMDANMHPLFLSGLPLIKLHHALRGSEINMAGCDGLGVYFHENGFPKKGCTTRPEKVLKRDGTEVDLEARSRVQFDSDGYYFEE